MTSVAVNAEGQTGRCHSLLQTKTTSHESLTVALSGKTLKYDALEKGQSGVKWNNG